MSQNTDYPENGAWVRLKKQEQWPCQQGRYTDYGPHAWFKSYIWKVLIDLSNNTIIPTMQFLIWMVRNTHLESCQVPYITGNPNGAAFKLQALGNEVIILEFAIANILDSVTYDLCMIQHLFHSFKMIPVLEKFQNWLLTHCLLLSDLSVISIHWCNVIPRGLFWSQRKSRVIWQHTRKWPQVMKRSIHPSMAQWVRFKFL